VAQYRARQWKEATPALTKAMELMNDRLESFNTLFLAMAHWQLGEKEKARHWYDRAVRWIEQNRHALERDRGHQEELRRFRAEAEALLGMQKD
jgi:hypothetical protein